MLSSRSRASKGVDTERPTGSTYTACLLCCSRPIAARHVVEKDGHRLSGVVNRVVNQVVNRVVSRVVDEKGSLSFTFLSSDWRAKPGRL